MVREGAGGKGTRPRGEAPAELGDACCANGGGAPELEAGRGGPAAEQGRRPGRWPPRARPRPCGPWALRA